MCIHSSLQWGEEGQEQYLQSPSLSAGLLFIPSLTLTPLNPLSQNGRERAKPHIYIFEMLSWFSSFISFAIAKKQHIQHGQFVGKSRQVALELADIYHLHINALDHAPMSLDCS